MYAKFDHDYALERYKKSLADKEDKKLTEPIPISTAGSTVKSDLTTLKFSLSNVKSITESFSFVLFFIIYRQVLKLSTPYLTLEALGTSVLCED